MFIILIINCYYYSSFLSFCSGEFLEVVSSQYTPEAINTTTSSIYSFLSPSFGGQEKAMQYFYQNWGSVNPVLLLLLIYYSFFIIDYF